MNEGKYTKALMALCIVVSVTAICVSAYAIIDDGGDGYDGVRYTMYFGLGDRTDAQVDEIEADIIGEITGHGYGYNLDRSNGGYIADGKVMKDRVSLRFVVTDPDDGDITEIINVIKERYGISAVFLEKDPVEAQFR